ALVGRRPAERRVKEQADPMAARLPLAVARRAPSPYRRRRVTNWIMTGLCALMVGVAVLPLISVLWLVISRGFSSLSLSFFTHLPAPVGETGGGIGNA